MHRLVALVEMAIADDLRERAQLLRLVAGRERQIRIGPVAHDAKAHEILALHVDLRERIFTARLPERLRVEFLGIAAKRFLDLVLDRQPMAIPARHVRRIEAVERARLDDDVLQDLVEGVADVDRAVRVRRTVVQDELGSVGRDRAQLVVDPVAFPPGEHLGLAPRQVRFHRKAVSGRLTVFL